jgi:tetratricopeptide (TPR) repeat protein
MITTTLAVMRVNHVPNSLSRRDYFSGLLDGLDDLPFRARINASISLKLISHGHTDDALRILQAEVEPTYKKIGDVRNLTVIRGKIADILQLRGQYGEALCIRQEEEIPIFEQSRDLRELAISKGKVADILRARGQADEALKLYREDVLPALLHLNDTREVAAIWTKIGQILYGLGEFDEAEHIFRTDVLPIYDLLADDKSRADTMGEIADTLQSNRRYEEAARIRNEEILPIYRRIKDARAGAITFQKIGLAVAEEQGIDGIVETLMAFAESFGIFQKLNDTEGIALVGLHLADVMTTVGLTEQILPVLAETEAALTKLSNSKGLEFAAILRARMASDE